MACFLRCLPRTILRSTISRRMNTRTQEPFFQFPQKLSDEQGEANKEGENGDKERSESKGSDDGNDGNQRTSWLKWLRGSTLVKNAIAAGLGGAAVILFRMNREDSFQSGNISTRREKAVFESMEDHLTRLDNIRLKEYYHIPERTIANLSSYEKGYSAEDIRVLCGPQGAGKSQIAKRLIRNRGLGVYISLGSVSGFTDDLNKVPDKLSGAAVLKSLGYLPLVINGDEHYDDFVNVMKRVLINMGKKYKKKPLIVIDDFQNAVESNHQFSPLMESVLRFFTEMSHHDIVDVLVVCDDISVIRPPLQKVSGNNIFQFIDVDWSPAADLTNPVSGFLGVSEEDAKYVLERLGGNLMEIRRIRSYLYASDPTRGKKYRSAKLLTLLSKDSGVEKQTSQRAISVSNAPDTKPPGGRSKDDVRQAVEQVLSEVTASVSYRLQDLPPEVRKDCFELLESLARYPTAYRRPLWHSTPEQASKIHEATRALLSANILRMDVRGNLLWYKPSVEAAYHRFIKK